MSLDQETLRRKNEELSAAYKDKNRKLLQTSELYDKLKRKSMLGHIHDAASDAVDTTLHSGLAMGPQSTDLNANHGIYHDQYHSNYSSNRYPDRPVQLGHATAQSGPGPLDVQNSAWAQQAAHPGKSLQQANGFLIKDSDIEKATCQSHRRLIGNGLVQV